MPNLVGCKFTFAGSHFGDLQEAIRLNPDMKFYVAENLLVSAMQIGAHGSCSSIVYTNSGFMLKMYQLARERNWVEAGKMQTRIADFFAGLDAELERLGAGGIDPVADKGLGLAAGGIVGHPRVRPPYIGWPERDVKAVHDWIKNNFPEFLAET